jgi:hypothetical protein
MLTVGPEAHAVIGRLEPGVFYELTSDPSTSSEGGHGQLNAWANYPVGYIEVRVADQG